MEFIDDGGKILTSVLTKVKDTCSYEIFFMQISDSGFLYTKCNKKRIQGS